ncbi:MAG: CGNR zinc finger domain-containing protein [Pseudomonadota bacterium]
MTYSEGHPIRLVGGRLVLDFVNTADWSDEGLVVHEKLATSADLSAWLAALDLGSARTENEMPALLDYRKDLRDLLLGTAGPGVMNALRRIDFADHDTSNHEVTGQLLEGLLAVSALSILMDKRERARLKMCPGSDCGWLFIDETKNGRRTWCRMDACGNRAKAARHYAKIKAERS